MFGQHSLIKVSYNLMKILNYFSKRSPDGWKSRLYKQSPDGARTNLKIGFQISSRTNAALNSRQQPGLFHIVLTATLVAYQE